MLDRLSPLLLRAFVNQHTTTTFCPIFSSAQPPSYDQSMSQRTLPGELKAHRHHSARHAIRQLRLCTMASQGTKRKRPDEEVVIKDASSEPSKEKKLRKSKKSKTLAKSAPDTESHSKQVVGESEHTQEVTEMKKFKKAKQKTTAEEAYSTDTLAERRARKKAAREALMVDEITDNEMLELLAQKEAQEELRKLAILNRVPLEVSLRSKTFSNENTDDVESDSGDYSSHEGIPDNISLSPTKITLKKATKGQAKSFEISENLPTVERAGAIKPLFANKRSSTGQKLSLSEPGLMIRTIAPDKPTAPLPTRARHPGPIDEASSLPKQISEPALSADSHTRPVGPDMTTIDTSSPRWHDTDSGSANYMEDDKTLLTLQIESKHVSGIIGQGGSRIKEIGEQTGTLIKFVIKDTKADLYTQCVIRAMVELLQQQRTAYFWRKPSSDGVMKLS